jgi:hypothetical protein
MGLAEAFIEHGHRGRRFRMYAGHGANRSRDTGSRTSRFAPRKAPPGCTACWAGAGTCCSCRAPRPGPHSAPQG